MNRGRTRLTMLLFLILLAGFSVSVFFRSQEKGPIPLVLSIIGFVGFMLLLIVFVRKEFAH